jgi:sugar O-acyltransferase (sialic acid O-acetyltransferase NeuD family)
MFGLDVVSYAVALANFPQSDWLVAVGSPFQRRRLSERIASANMHEGIFVSSRAYVAPGFIPSPGIQIFAGCAISSNVSIGRGAIVNFNSSLSHEVRIGEFVTISPNCAIAGRVLVEDDAFLGVGAVVLPSSSEQPLSIRRGAIIGAGAVVNRSVPASAVVAGVPARLMKEGTKC